MPSSRWMSGTCLHRECPFWTLLFVLEECCSNGCLWDVGLLVSYSRLPTPPRAAAAPVARTHRYPPHMVAIACLQMASKIHDVDIAIWYAALQVNDTEIIEISAMLTESYTVSTSCMVWCVRVCVGAWVRYCCTAARSCTYTCTLSFPLL